VRAGCANAGAENSASQTDVFGAGLKESFVLSSSKHAAARCVMRKVLRRRQYLCGPALRYFDVAQYQGERFF